MILNFLKCEQLYLKFIFVSLEKLFHLEKKDLLIHVWQKPLPLYKSVTVLVCFHFADKCLLKTGQFLKERGLLGLQFHMLGEASQSLWEVKRSKSHLTWMAAGKKKKTKKVVQKLRILTLSDLVRPIHYHQNSLGKTRPHDSVISH